MLCFLKQTYASKVPPFAELRSGMSKLRQHVYTVAFLSPQGPITFDPARVGFQTLQNFLVNTPKIARRNAEYEAR